MRRSKNAVPVPVFLFREERNVARGPNRESRFQASLVKEIESELPGCIVTKLDSGHIQGIPDLLVLNGRNWATLECKRGKDAPVRPNQRYYVERMDSMSFSRFVYPENKDEVLADLKAALTR